MTALDLRDFVQFRRTARTARAVSVHAARTRDKSPRLMISFAPRVPTPKITPVLAD